MEKHTVSFRLETEKVSALDAVAQALDRDRTYLLNEAVNAYLEVQQWQIAQIRKSLRQADKGELMAHTDVKKAARRWRRK